MTDATPCRSSNTRPGQAPSSRGTLRTIPESEAKDLGRSSARLTDLKVIGEVSSKSILVALQTEPSDHPSRHIGQQVLVATRERWLAYANDILKKLDPVYQEDVPMLLKRIEDALK